MRVRIRMAAAAMVWVAACALASAPPAQGQVAALDPRWELLGAPTNSELHFDPRREEFFQLVGDGRGGFVLWTIPSDPARPPRPRATTGEAPDWGARLVVLDVDRARLLYVGVGHRARALSLDTGEWSVVLVGGLPPPVKYGGWSPVFDPSRGRWILFGGGGAEPSYFEPVYEATNRVWEIAMRRDSLYWNEVLPSGVPPSPRFRYGAAMDRAADRMLVFGGTVQPTGGYSWTYSDELWELTFSPDPAWRQVLPMSSSPPPQAAAHVIVQRDLGRVVLMGGDDGLTGNPEPWSFPLEPIEQAAWAPLATTGTAPGKNWPLAFESTRRAAVVLSGAGTPLLPELSRYGGRCELDLSVVVPRWRELTPSVPAPASPGVAAYDFGRDRLYTMYTREGATNLQPASMMLWAADLADPPAWSAVDSSAELAHREGFTLVHDAHRERLILFGGRTGALPSYAAPPAVSNDVWVRDLPGGAWMPMIPDGALPAPRADHAAVYDPVGDRMLMFGGESYGAPTAAERFGDLWELSLSGAQAWRRLDASDPRPAPRRGAAVALDTAARRLYVHGGADVDTLADLWAFSLDDGVWTPIVTSGPGPGALSDHAMAFDGTRSLLYVLPSHVQTSPYLPDAPTAQEVWALDLAAAAPPAWSSVQAPGIVPPRVGGRSAFLSRGLDALVLYQEQVPLGFADSREPWNMRALRLGDGSDTASAGLVRAWADESGAHLRWRLAGSAAAWMSVERRTARDEWRSLDLLNTDRWLVAVDDASVIPGWTYEYRLEIWKPLDPAYSPIARLTIPGGPATMRAQFAPVRNPAPTAPRFQFLLAGAPEGTARVELLDVSGRRLDSTEIPVSGAGPYTVDFARRTGRPGIYFARLSVNGVEVATTRVVAFID